MLSPCKQSVAFYHHSREFQQVLYWPPYHRVQTTGSVAVAYTESVWVALASGQLPAVHWVVQCSL